MSAALDLVHDMVLHQADQAALTRMHAVDPVWHGMALMRDVIAFADRTILHAGPPVDPDRIANPLLNSAVLAALFEGWACNEDEAVNMIRNREIVLAPAQDCGAMVPLAAVLSPNMVVHVVYDRSNPDNVAYSPINGGGNFAARFGVAGEKALAHLRWINGNLAATLAIISDRPIPLLPIADAAIADGDDAHGKTVSASARLVETLAPRLGSDTPERRFIDAAPGFFLTPWMAAAKCIARAAEGEGSSIVTALGGNGVDVGIKLGGRSDRWLTTAAAPPEGVLNEGFKDSDRLGAIGDSALVDAIGFGAMLARTNSDAAELLPAVHPAFHHHRLAVGLPARQSANLKRGPSIALGIIERSGRHGRIGGGIYRPPIALLIAAVSQLPSIDLNKG